MKRDILDSTIIDLDKSFAKPTETALVVEEQNYIDFGRILNEVSYKLPKGYPTIVNGVLTEREEVIIINEALEAEGLSTLPLPEADTQPQVIRESATDDKENTVCVVIDIMNHFAKKAEPLLKQHFDLIKAKAFMENSKLHKDYIANKKSIRAFNLESTIGSSQYNHYSKSIGGVLDIIGLGKSNKIDAKVALNSISAGLGIYNTITKKAANIFRAAEFNNIRKHAATIYKDETGQKIEPDNWCPGDVYVSYGDPTKNALQSDSIVLETSGKNPLNKYFNNQPSSKTFTAISLKQESAQAGKATTFTRNVFQTNIKIDSSPADYTEGKNTDKQQLKLLKTVGRFEAYASNPTARELKQPATKILEKGLDVLSYAGVIQQKEKRSIKQKLNAKFNVPLIKLNTKDKEVSAFIQQVSKVAAGAKKSAGDDIKSIRKRFLTARQAFIQALGQSNVDVKSATKSEELFKKMQQELEDDAPTYLVQKAATYDFFTNIFNDWTNKTKGSLKPHFQAISKVSNPFVALTMFAIAEAGISPPFIKAIGSEQSADGAHMDSFDHNYVINDKLSAKEVIISDSAKAAGFDAKFVMDFKTKKYSIKLSFRFSGTEIRIEVQELTKI
jgi:hypothetical protein